MIYKGYTNICYWNWLTKISIKYKYFVLVKFQAKKASVVFCRRFFVLLHFFFSFPHFLNLQQIFGINSKTIVVRQLTIKQWRCLNHWSTFTHELNHFTWHYPCPIQDLQCCHNLPKEDCRLRAQHSHCHAMFLAMAGLKLRFDPGNERVHFLKETACLRYSIRKNSHQKSGHSSTCIWKS